LMCPRVGTDRADLRLSSPVEKTPPSHREPTPTTTSGLLPPRWKSVGRVRTSLGQVPSVEKTRRQLSQVAQCGRVMSINLVFDLYTFGLCRCARKKGRQDGRCHKKCIFHVCVERLLAGGFQPNGLSL